MSETSFRRGRRGEAEAARHLEARGWTVLDRNWRDGPRELDLVVRRGPILAFVEVKTRGEGGWGHPLDAITFRKRREVERAARAWLGAHPTCADADDDVDAEGAKGIRFDAVVVHLPYRGPPAVEHIPDAWRPGWD